MLDSHLPLSTLVLLVGLTTEIDLSAYSSRRVMVAICSGCTDPCYQSSQIPMPMEEVHIACKQLCGCCFQCGAKTGKPAWLGTSLTPLVPGVSTRSVSGAFEHLPAFALTEQSKLKRLPDPHLRSTSRWIFKVQRDSELGPPETTVG